MGFWPTYRNGESRAGSAQAKAAALRKGETTNVPADVKLNLDRRVYEHRSTPPQRQTQAHFGSNSTRPCRRLLGVAAEPGHYILRPGTQLDAGPQSRLRLTRYYRQPMTRFRGCSRRNQFSAAASAPMSPLGEGIRRTLPIRLFSPDENAVSPDRAAARLYLQIALRRQRISPSSPTTASPCWPTGSILPSVR